MLSVMFVMERNGISRLLICTLDKVAFLIKVF